MGKENYFRKISTEELEKELKVLLSMDNNGGMLANDIIEELAMRLPNVKNNSMITHKTIFEKDFRIEESDRLFEQQKEITGKLDNINKPFDQGIINEIVLWKVNRYASISNETFELINKIDAKSKVLNVDLTSQILKELLHTKGIQLPMASTILRFKNKYVYQIIDQRVYRIIYQDKKLKLTSYLNDKNLTDQITLYLKYLADLKTISRKLRIPFETADRDLYMADKRINKNIPIDNF